ncbi:MAG: hypothetical protein B7Z43_06500 [Sphingomonas sp. 12-62-6]|nr:MAG: hypothetical protein B7Z43_06500 [Sphingomonas sp. 12-62-6]
MKSFAYLNRGIIGMHSFVSRAMGGSLALCLLLSPQISTARQASAASPPKPTASSRYAAPPATSWQHVGSDIPADPQWQTGTLANGLRYAVRRNAKPAGSVSIRVRLDVGALMERDEEQGWAHFVEHMAFRGTPKLGDGEAVKVWQRMGASFGADTNASTTRLSTIYKLDLPKADAESVTIATNILADMLANASFDPRLVEIERKVVLAERSARLTPFREKLRRAISALVVPGLLAARRDIIGTPETLGGASADGLRAFQRRWYRPERAVVVMAGDAPTSQLIAAIEASFGGWRGEGPPPAEPDYGKMVTPTTEAVSVIDPLASSAVAINWVRPYVYEPETVRGTTPRLVQSVALAILNRRLSTEAQRGGAIIDASATYSRGRRTNEVLSISLTPKTDQWSAALDRTFAIVNELRDSPPAQAEVEAVLADRKLLVDRAIITRADAASPSLVDEFMGDVDSGSVTVSPEVIKDLFEGAQSAVTPAAIQAEVRTILTPEPRLILTGPKPIAGGDTALVAALGKARNIAAAETEAVRSVSFDELKAPGPPGKIVRTQPLPEIDAERITFANGVELALKKTGIEQNNIRVLVQIGHGLLNRNPDATTLQWSFGALISSGVGPFSADEFQRLVTGRQLGFSYTASVNSLDLHMRTNPKDLTDGLRLMTTLAQGVRYGDASLDRFKRGYESSYASLYNQPGSVLGAYGEKHLTNGDNRFAGAPDPATVNALTNADFRAYWDARMAEGPIKLVVVGDFDRAALIAAVAASFGALQPRQAVPPTPTQLDVRPSPPTKSPITLYHRGATDQAIVMHYWPTTGVYADIAESRALSMAGSILNTRLQETFREQQGGSYAPSAGSSQSPIFPRFGTFSAGAQLTAGMIPAFDKALDAAIAELATNGPTADAMERARSTILSDFAREKSSNAAVWVTLLSRDLDDPRVLSVFLSREAGYAAVTAAQVQAAVRKYLKPGGSIDIRVLPEPAKPAK